MRGMTDNREHGAGPALYGGEIGPDERLAMNRTGSFDWDLDAGTIDVDVAGLLVFGQDPDLFDARPVTLVQRLDTHERARLEGVIKDALSSGRSSYASYFRLEREGGTEQWTHVQARILRDHSSRAHRIVGIVRDATSEVTHSEFVMELEKRRRRQTDMVERSTRAMSRAVTVDDVTAALTGPGGLSRLGADGLALGLVENGQMNIIALSGDSLEMLDDMRVRRLESGLPLHETVLSGRPLFTSSFQEMIKGYPQLAPFAGRLPFRAAAYLPLVAQARTLGGMVLFYRRHTTFSADERNLTLGLAAIVAQSLQRAILFDEERELATGLQATMLPRRIPAIEGGEIAVRYHSAWSGRQVGGDWYDVISLPRGQVGIVVGDVQGHDTHAACRSCRAGCRWASRRCSRTRSTRRPGWIWCRARRW